MPTVYIIRNNIDDRVYIGSTVQKISVRMTQHRSRANKGVRRYYIYDVMREYGVENFYIEPLQDNVPEEDLYRIEQEFIRNYPHKDKLLNTANGISYAEVPYIISEYQAGRRVKDIAKELGRDKETISRALKDNGIEVKDWNDIQRIEITESDLRHLYEEKLLTTPEIAKLYNTSHCTISKYLKRFGITPRKAVNRKYLHLPPPVETQE